MYIIENSLNIEGSEKENFLPYRTQKSDVVFASKNTTRNVFVVAQFCMHVNCRFTYANVSQSMRIQNVRLAFHGRTGNVHDASLVLKDWIAITEELRLFCVSVSPLWSRIHRMHHA